MQTIQSNSSLDDKSTRQTLSNVQLELLKLYSMDLSQAEMVELKSVLSKHFAGKAVSEADKLWENNGLCNADMTNWLNEH